MQVVHETDGERRTLARDVELAEGILAAGIGLMFRRSIPDDFAIVFPFPSARTRSLHMLFVPFDIDAVWVVDDEVKRVERLAAWRGLGSGRADTIVELPAGAADGVAVGDVVRVRDD